jgi:hypothetical protein
LITQEGTKASNLTKKEIQQEPKQQDIKRVNVIKLNSGFLIVLVKIFGVITKKESTESNSPLK